MRVFLGLTEIAGYYANLRLGLAELGIDTLYIDLSLHSFRYSGTGDIHPLVRIIHFSVAQRTSGNIGRRLFWKSLDMLARSVLLIWAIVTCDVFIFGFHTSFFSYVELPLLKLLGKRVIYVFHGSDVRPAYLDGSLMAQDRGRTTAKCIRLTRHQALKLRVTDYFADVIVSHPPFAHFHRRRFVPFLRIGLPYAITTPPSGSPPEAQNRPIRVLHSPSHPEAKGTPEIREAIRRLQAKGHPVELVELTGVTNAVVLADLARCDFVVDQVYSDTPMAGFATEAAHFGKPTVVGGYAQEVARLGLPDELVPPSIYCRPEELESSIERMITDVEYRLALGRAAQAFVLREWSPQAVAARFVRIIRDEVPADWLVDPNEIHYLYGGGLSITRARELVRAILAAGGPRALQLRHRPDLERQMVAFARERD